MEESLNQEIEEKVNEFLSGIDSIKIKGIRGRPVAFVTSGGTSAKLEKNAVRTLENFSTGTRGARSAECFLKNGLPVIFLHRKGSLQPFSVELQNDWAKWGPKIFKDQAVTSDFKQSIESYQKYNLNTSIYSKMLLKLEYETV